MTHVGHFPKGKDQDREAGSFTVLHDAERIQKKKGSMKKILGDNEKRVEEITEEKHEEIENSQDEKRLPAPDDGGDPSQQQEDDGQDGSSDESVALISLELSKREETKREKERERILQAD